MAIFPQIYGQTPSQEELTNRAQPRQRQQQPWQRPQRLADQPYYDPEHGFAGVGSRIAASGLEGLKASGEALRDVMMGIGRVGHYLFADPNKQQQPQEPIATPPPAPMANPSFMPGGEHTEAPGAAGYEQSPPPSLPPPAMPTPGQQPPTGAASTLPNMRISGRGQGGGGFADNVPNLIQQTQARVAAPQPQFKSSFGDFLGFDSDVNRLHQSDEYQTGRAAAMTGVGNEQIQQELMKYLPAEHLMKQASDAQMMNLRVAELLPQILSTIPQGPQRDLVTQHFLRLVGTPQAQQGVGAAKPTTPTPDGGRGPLATGVESAIPGFAAAASTMLPKALGMAGPWGRAASIALPFLTAPAAEWGLSKWDTGLPQAQRENPLSTAFGVGAGYLFGNKALKGKGKPTGGQQPANQSGSQYYNPYNEPSGTAPMPQGRKELPWNPARNQQGAFEMPAPGAAPGVSSVAGTPIPTPKPPAAAPPTPTAPPAQVPVNQPGAEEQARALSKKAAEGMGAKGVAATKGGKKGAAKKGAKKAAPTTNPAASAAVPPATARLSLIQDYGAPPESVALMKDEEVVAKWLELKGLQGSMMDKMMADLVGGGTKASAVNPYAMQGASTTLPSGGVNPKVPIATNPVQWNAPVTDIEAVLNQMKAKAVPGRGTPRKGGAFSVQYPKGIAPEQGTVPWLH